MVEFSTIAIYAMLASLFAYIALLVKRNSDNNAEDVLIGQLEKIAEYLASTKSLDKAIRLVIAEQPTAMQKYANIAAMVDSGMEIGKAFEEAAGKESDAFFKRIFIMLASAGRKNDADSLYKAVHKMKEASELRSKIDSKSEVAAWTLQFVFALVMPLLFYFMLSILNVTADKYINAFLGLIVVSSIIMQGVVYRQWASALVKVPLLFSAFYWLYFIIALKFLAGFMASF